MSTANYQLPSSFTSSSQTVTGDSTVNNRIIVGGSTAPVSSSGTGAIRFNASTSHMEFSENGSSWAQFGTSSGSMAIGNAIGNSTAGSVLFVDGSGNLGQDNTKFYWDDTNIRFGAGTGSPVATLDGYQKVATSGSPMLLRLFGAAHTTLAATTEVNDVFINLSRIVQINAGNISTQRAVLISAPTYSFTSASTITNAATLAVSGAPVPGTNATITNTYSIWAQAGLARFDGHINIDGYKIDLSGGASSTQVLAYNGTAFVPTNASAGSIGGSIASNQIAYGSGTNTILGSANLTYNGTTLTVAQHISVDGYTIDISAGATNGQALVYNSSSGKFVAQTVSGTGAGIGTSGQKYINIIPGTFYTSINSTTATVIGGFQVNASDYILTGATLSFVFRAVVALGSTTVTGTIRLRNITDGIDVTTLTFNSGTTADTTMEATVTGSIPSSTKIYEVRATCSNVVNPSDFMQIFSAELRAINTIN